MARMAAEHMTRELMGLSPDNPDVEGCLYDAFGTANDLVVRFRVCHLLWICCTVACALSNQALVRQQLRSALLWTFGRLVGRLLPFECAVKYKQLLVPSVLHCDLVIICSPQCPQCLPRWSTAPRLQPSQRHDVALRCLLFHCNQGAW